MGWLGALWAQAFRADLVIEPARFLRGNIVLGLFAVIAISAGARDPQRTTPVFSALLALTVLTHVGGFVLAAVMRRAVEPILFVQGLCLFATTCALVAMSTVLTLRADTLSNVRYVPGLTLALFMYASFELYFFAPGGRRVAGVRRLCMIAGVAAEVVMAAALIYRLVQRG